MYQRTVWRKVAEFPPERTRDTPRHVERVTPRVGKPISTAAVPKLASRTGMNETADLNLTTHRSPDSVWGRSGWDGSPQRLTATRWLVGVGGGVLAVQGLRQRSLTGSILAGLGGSLAWWALTGEGDLSDARRWFTSVMARVTGDADDAISQASAESFPASDAPSFTPTVGTGIRHARPAAH